MVYSNTYFQELYLRVKACDNSVIALLKDDLMSFNTCFSPLLRGLINYAYHTAKDLRITWYLETLWYTWSDDKLKTYERNNYEYTN